MRRKKTTAAKEKTKILDLLAKLGQELEADIDSIKRDRQKVEEEKKKVEEEKKKVEEELEK